MQPKLFLSYSRRDEHIAEAVIKSAAGRTIDVWYDKLIPAGQDWRDSIVDAIRNCDVVLILFSEESNNSRQMLKELAIADRLGKLVIPVLLEATEPRGPYLYELAWRNWAVLYPDPLGRIDALLDRIIIQLSVPPHAAATTGSVPVAVMTQPRGTATAATIAQAPGPRAARPPGSAAGAALRRAPARRAPALATVQPDDAATAATRGRALAPWTGQPLGSGAGARSDRAPVRLPEEPPGSATGARSGGAERPGMDRARGKSFARTVWWPERPIVLRDVLALGPIVCILFIIGVSTRNDNLPAINMFLSLVYMILVIVRSARLNIGINTWKPFLIYLAVGGVLSFNVAAGLVISGRESADIGNLIAGGFATAIMAALLAGVATLLQFVLRRILQLSLFKTRIRSTLPIS